VKIKNIRLQNFRNITFADICLDSQYIWICGKNAQGKSNLLESLSLLTALRSFRTAKLKNLINYNSESAEIIADLSHEILGDMQMEITLGKNKKSVKIDGKEITRLADFIGLCPTVSMCSEDLRILRDTPAVRRKFIDIFISSIDKEYLEALRKFHSAIEARNVLLKQESSEGEFFAFEKEMSLSAEIVASKRKYWLKILAQKANCIYSKIAESEKEKSAFVLKANCEFESAKEYFDCLQKNREKEKIFGSTLHGPHKDDFLILISGKTAQSFASEGQQRSIVLSLRLAQLEIIKEITNVNPILLCDDILGELDSARKEAFWNLLDSSLQIIATATTMPEQNTRHWKILQTTNGEIVVQP